jgi:glycine/D-amino acid oxidase-like deaminating enzyme
MRKDSFDYIIAGGGLAGLSLAFYLNESEHLRGKKVLIIDRDAKRRNDRTWCFWEREPGAFEDSSLSRRAGVFRFARSRPVFLQDDPRRGFLPVRS